MQTVEAGKTEDVVDFDVDADAGVGVDVDRADGAGFDVVVVDGDAGYDDFDDGGIELAGWDDA